jgi:hypothetical protein
MPTKNKTSKEVEMNTVKRLILIEASLQQIPTYTGKFNESGVILHDATQLIDLVSRLK